MPRPVIKCSMKLGTARIESYIQFQSSEPGPPLATSTTSKQDKVLISSKLVDSIQIIPLSGFHSIQNLPLSIFIQFRWAKQVSDKKSHHHPSKVLLTTMRDELYCTPSSRIVNIEYEIPLDHKVGPTLLIRFIHFNFKFTILFKHWNDF